MFQQLLIHESCWFCRTNTRQGLISSSFVKSSYSQVSMDNSFVCVLASLDRQGNWTLSMSSIQFILHSKTCNLQKVAATVYISRAVSLFLPPITFAHNPSSTQWKAKKNFVRDRQLLILSFAIRTEQGPSHYNRINIVQPLLIPLSAWVVNSEIAVWIWQCAIASGTNPAPNEGSARVITNHSSLIKPHKMPLA